MRPGVEHDVAGYRLLRAWGWAALAEEASVAYKDVAVCDSAGLSRKVARLRPLKVIKG